MARKTKTVLVCDRHRRDTDAVETVQLVIGGERRRFDLCAEHLAEFRKVMRPWVSAAGKSTATRAAGPKPRRDRAEASAKAQRMREWARENGYEISDRGRMPSSVIGAYETANR